MAARRTALRGSQLLFTGRGTESGAAAHYTSLKLLFTGQEVDSVWPGNNGGTLTCYLAAGGLILAAAGIKMVCFVLIVVLSLSVW